MIPPRPLGSVDGDGRAHPRADIAGAAAAEPWRGTPPPPPPPPPPPAPRPADPARLPDADGTVAVLLALAAVSVMAIVVVWPEGARPVLSVLAAILLAALLLEVLRRLDRRRSDPLTSRFTRQRAPRPRPEHPDEFTGIAAELGRARRSRRDRRLPAFTTARVRTRAINRLYWNHQLDLRLEPDQAAIADKVSAPLLRLLVGDGDLRLSDLPQLIDEVEHL